MRKKTDELRFVFLPADTEQDCRAYIAYELSRSDAVNDDEEMEMDQSVSSKADYGNWVSTRLIYVPATLGISFLILAYWLPILVILTLLFLAIAGYFAYARYLFSPQGRNVQAQIHDLLLTRFDWNGEGQVVDIGCGNGAMSIKLAKKYPKATVVGVDYWGGNWQYSKSVCEKNAQIEGVDQRVSFQKSSASKLPFPDGCFEAAVSNLTFHEVADAKDKREVIREALRVVKPGGKFAFQDLFLIEREYGKIDDLLQGIRAWGIRNVEFVESRDAQFIPPALKLPFMVGTIGIILGEK
jgi:SAM-dependent methyltransferase